MDHLTFLGERLSRQSILWTWLWGTTNGLGWSRDFYHGHIAKQVTGVDVLGWRALGVERAKVI